MSVRMCTVGLGLLALAWIVVTGCSRGPAEEPKVSVKGRLTNAGQPLPVAPSLADKKEARPRLEFIREGGGQATVAITALTEPDGSFEAKVPKGKYRIGVAQPYAPAASENLLDKFSSRSSPIFREVTGDGQPIDVDLSKPQGP